MPTIGVLDQFGLPDGAHRPVEGHRCRSRVAAGKSPWYPKAAVPPAGSEPLWAAFLRGDLASGTGEAGIPGAGDLLATREGEFQGPALTASDHCSRS